MTIEQRTAEIISQFEPPRALALAGHTNESELRKLLDAAKARIELAAASLANTTEALEALTTANNKVTAANVGLSFCRTDFKRAAFGIAEAEQAATDVAAFVV